MLIKKKHAMRYTAGAIGLGLFALGVANRPKAADATPTHPITRGQISETISEITTTTAHNDVAVKMANAKPNLQKVHGYVSASALLWNVLTDNQDIGVINDSTTTGSTLSKQTSNWGWNWGFKASLGGHTESKDWDASINFAFLSAKRSFSSSNPFFLPLTGSYETIATPTTTNGGFYQKNTLSYFDTSLILSRECLLSKRLSFTPLAGIKASFFNQKSSINYAYTTDDGVTVTSFSDSTSIQNNFWGVGPQAGTGVRFGFSKHFALDCQIDGALLWGQILSHQNINETNLSVPTTPSVQKNRYPGDKSQLVPNANIMGAFVYDTNFAENSVNMSISLGYESRFFFNNIETSLYNTRQKGSTAMQGVTLGLDFSY